MTRSACLAGFRVLVFAIALAGLAPAAAFAQNPPTYLRVDGVTGESTNDRHVGWIDLISYSQTVGTKACARVVVMKYLDRSSPGLVAYAAANTVIPTAVVEITRGDAPQNLVFRATMEQVQIGQTEIVEQDLVWVAEKVVLLPRLVRLQYYPQNRDGSMGSPVTSTVTCP
jgi:type VI protein secretion system component Hcp